LINLVTQIQNKPSLNGNYRYFRLHRRIICGCCIGPYWRWGSILTVPVMVYLFYLNPVTATAYSLFVVGTTALVGAIRNIPKKRVDFKTAIIFATPAFISVYLTRRYFIPAVPDELFAVNDFIVTKGIGIMIFFALIMLL